MSSSPSARADEPPRTRDVALTMHGSGFYDVGFLAITGAMLYAGTHVLEPSQRGLPPLDGLGRRERVPHLDVAGDYSLRFGVGFGVTLAWLTDLSHGRHGVESLRGPLVIGEGALAASAFTQLLKNVFGVCRPRDWEPTERRCGLSGENPSRPEREQRTEAHRSFPSGHNAPLAGVAGAALGLYLLPSERRPEYVPVALTATGFALTTVVLREQAGAHSWVDTGAAFVSGGAAGFLTALLHLSTTHAASSPRSPVGAVPAVTPLASFAGAFLPRVTQANAARQNLRAGARQRAAARFLFQQLCPLEPCARQGTEL